MILITNSRTEAKQIAQQIQAWREANIEGYNAESWANCQLPDEEYDKLYKHQTDDLWYIPIDIENALALEGVDSLPDGWRAENIPEV